MQRNLASSLFQVTFKLMRICVEASAGWKNRQNVPMNLELIIRVFALSKLFRSLILFAPHSPLNVRYSGSLGFSLSAAMFFCISPRRNASAAAFCEKDRISARRPHFFCNRRSFLFASTLCAFSAMILFQWLSNLI